MCNAFNHPSGCNCGWGGVYSGGGGYSGGGVIRTAYSALSDSIKSFALKAKEDYKSSVADTREARTYLTTCWWCGAEVFYHTNGYGDSVLFDNLGWPWQVHSCWETYWNKEKIRRQRINRFYTKENFWDFDQDEQKRLILAGAIQTVRSQKCFVQEEDVASCLGLTLKLFRKYYSLLYKLYLEENVIQLRLI